jgi:indole-3-glycerol phosphate synthase
VILDRIVESTRMRVARVESEISLAEVKEAARRREPARDFAGALNGAGVSLIAEVKRASPSRGPLRPDLDASSLAREYSAGGAAAISVLTEKDHFLGGFADLEAARDAAGLPVLCKDFVIEKYQV